MASTPVQISQMQLAERDISAAQLVITYVTLVPLIVFAVHGGFSFAHGSWNSELGAYGGKIAVASSPDEMVRDSVQSWVALVLCAALAFPYCGRIVYTALRMRLMVVLPAYAIASSAWSQDAGLSLRSGISLMLVTIFAFYLSSSLSHKRQSQLVVMTGACVAVASVVIALLWPEFGIDHQAHEGAWQGLFTQKNACAEAMLFLLTPALAMPGTGRFGQPARAAYIVLCLFVILMSQSRTGWTMTAIYLAFVCSLRILGRFRRKQMLPIVALLLVIAGASVAFAVSNPSMLLELIGRSDGLSGRTQIWNAILASILHRPIVGYGYDAFWSLPQGEVAHIFAAAGWVVTSAHNGFLNVFLELGMIGIVLIAGTFLQAFRDASRVFHPGHSRYVEWCIGIVFLTLLYNLDERTLLATQYLPWVLYIVACTGLNESASAALNSPAPLAAEARA